jgi:fructosamine-3-kinase
MSEPRDRGGARSDRRLLAIGEVNGIADPLLLAALDRAVRDHGGEHCVLEGMRRVGGGCIHRTFALECRGARFFVKINDTCYEDAFAAESDGLAALRRAGMRAPEPLAAGVLPRAAYLLLEHLDLAADAAGSARELGRALARLHHAEAHSRYGWHRANFIGATPQPNGWHDDWARFWCEQRIAPQLALARRNALGDAVQALGARLLPRIPALLAGHAPQPALVHGDLWSGNAGTLVSGEPVVFDPAVYVGDGEVDLAMTQLFGGFPRAFYAGYAEVTPIAAGYEARKPLYNLYHVLNHANLFGGGYVGQAEHMMEHLLGRG